MELLRKIGRFIRRLAAEPPFRLITRILVKYAPTSMRTKALWDAVDRPHYLMGVLRATDQAKFEGATEISVCEFGVSYGEGLLLLQEYAAAVEQETGIKVWVYGFDCGTGLPQLTGDYRDHPDFYQEGDYPANPDNLRAKLTPRSQLILGDVADTVPEFVAKTQKAPIGFAAIDVDLYTSTRDSLQIFSLPDKKMLRRAYLYFDELDLDFFHKFAGEFLAIDEFNDVNEHVKIDKWHGIKRLRPFPENYRLDGMYVAHDLDAITNVKPEDRAPKDPT